EEGSPILEEDAADSEASSDPTWQPSSQGTSESEPFSEGESESEPFSEPPSGDDSIADIPSASQNGDEEEGESDDDDDDDDEIFAERGPKVEKPPFSFEQLMDEVQEWIDGTIPDQQIDPLIEEEESSLDPSTVAGSDSEEEEEEEN
ncbi:hypothetical protein Fcan01_26702, partial [Folsomia candida]